MAEESEDQRKIRDDEIRSPVGLMMQSIEGVGAELTEDFVIRMKDEET